MKPATRKLFSLEDLKKLGRTFQNLFSYATDERESESVANNPPSRDEAKQSIEEKTKELIPTPPSKEEKTKELIPTPPSKDLGKYAYSQYGVKQAFRYESDASLCLPEHTGFEDVKLIVTEDVGIHSRASIESTVELGFGLDFGTSSVKVVINNRNQRESYAVPFLKNKTGIATYLLPSAMYVTRTGNCSLTIPRFQGNFDRFSSLKLDLLNNRNSRDAQDRVVAFLALVIRQTRAWLFTRYPKFASELIEWRVCIGVPSNQQDTDLLNLWRRLLAAAWKVAGEQCKMSLSRARRALNTITNDNYDEEGTQFSSLSEIISETIAFLENHPQKNASQDYLIIDVGSGTFDMACFSLSRTDAYYKTDLAHTVCRLGTTNIHHNRLRWLKTAIESDCYFFQAEKERELLYQWIREIDEELQRTLRSPLVNETKEYLIGVSPFKDTFIEVDEALKEEISYTISGLKDKLWKEGKLPLNRIGKLQIFLCGGGADSEFYRKSISLENDFIKSRLWAKNNSFSLFQGVGALRMASEYPITQKDHSRLIVACGLSYSRDVQECAQQQEVISQPEGFSYYDRFVGKEQI